MSNRFQDFGLSLEGFIGKFNGHFLSFRLLFLPIHLLIYIIDIKKSRTKYILIFSFRKIIPYIKHTFLYVKFDLEENTMMSKKWFWVVMSIMAIIGIVLSVALFDNAFPIVNDPITMNRNMAIQKADSVGMSVYNMPSDMKKTDMFGSDNMFKNYVELDGGGAEALQE